MSQRAFIDANVLWSRAQRDWLFAMGQTGKAPFTQYSSEDVITEVLYNMRRKKPELTGKQIGALQAGLHDVVEIIDDFDPSAVKEEYLGADADDLHVHAAAVSGKCSYLVTNDRKLYGSLTAEELDSLPYDVLSADEFFCLAVDSHPIFFDAALTIELNYWKAKNEDDSPRLNDLLVKAGCPKFARLVERALCRKAGMPPKEIDATFPLGDEYSLDLREDSLSDLEDISPN